MKSIREIYKIGKGPSSSHTMGPERAAHFFKNKYPDAESYQVILYGSLSKTGIGHGTDRVLREVLSPLPTEIVFSKEELPKSAHPNTMDFIAINDGVDSINGINDFSGLKNYINDFYARDTSSKIRAVQRAKGERGSRSGNPNLNDPYHWAQTTLRKILCNRAYC